MYIISEIIYFNFEPIFKLGYVVLEINFGSQIQVIIRGFKLRTSYNMKCGYSAY